MNDGQTESDDKLSSARVIYLVEVRLVRRIGDHVCQFDSWGASPLEHSYRKEPQKSIKTSLPLGFAQ